MMWIDIAGIVFVCVTMNHLGLVKAIEDTFGVTLYIVNCVKCCTFYPVLLYTTIVSHDVITSLAISFLASYMAIWLELFEGFIDTLYEKLYEKIYTDATDDKVASAERNHDSDCSMSDVRKKE